MESWRGGGVVGWRGGGVERWRGGGVEGGGAEGRRGGGVAVYSTQFGSISAHLIGWSWG